MRCFPFPFKEISPRLFRLLSEVQKAGLEEVTTKRQNNNGTRTFFDPQRGVYYSVYSSGYVRRVPDIKRGSFHYPVNKRKRGSDLSYITIPSLEGRIKRMLEAVENYRLSHKVLILGRKFPELSSRCLRELAVKNYAYFSSDYW